ncbi:hypothetical protein C0993_011752 [Termitomyces sp. T159_Od127]|nr:hypothetical protein C0993_011752 [Termitomyces sp. T159_Od127]
MSRQIFGEGEGVVVAGLISGGGLRVVLGEEGVPGGIVNLVQDTFFVHNQHSMKMFRWEHHSMVECVALHLKQLLGVHIQSPGDGVRLGTKPELITTGVYLQEYTGDSIVRSIALEDDGEGGVKVAEDGGGGEGFLEEGEYTLALAVPVPWSILSREPVEGFGDPRVVINETAIEIGKTKEGLHFFYTLGWRLVEDGFHLSRVHVNAIQGGYDAEVLDFGSMEQALLWFSM